MKVEIKVPAMGESISEAIVGEIFKPTGTVVTMDDEILELETDKVNQVLYAPQSGVIEITVNTEDTVTIGQVIGNVDTEGAATAPSTPVAAIPAKEEQPAAPASVADVPSGSGARITKEDYVREIKEPTVKQAVPQQAAAPTPQAVQPPTPTPAPAPVTPTPAPAGERTEVPKRMSRLRQVIAKRLVEVQLETAMLTSFNEVDLTEVMALRKKYQEKFVKDHDVKLGFMSFFVKASVSALKAFPDVNAYINGTDIVYRHYYDVSIAVSTDKGLVVPVVRNCDKLSFAEVEQEIINLANKARDGGLTVDDLQGGGFTITNGGIYGSLLSTPILNPPQSAILGMHAIQKRPVVVDDEIVIRPMMYLALSYDHRIIDGKEAVSFLVHIKNSLEDPARLLIDV
ncbi:MAG: 2-oxoglutarate dehydrogenase complex dihydrolipoyllysine-residue succinyltransferase [Chlamydiota bacterium]